MLEAALAAGLASAGAHVALGGVLPTPAAPLLVRGQGFDLAAVISASHNPYADNGIKFFGGDGFKLSDETEREIELHLEEDLGGGDHIGRIAEMPGTADRYLAALHERFADLDLAGLDVVLDCANGATFAVGPEIFRRLGARVTLLHADPDGRNINDGCGSTHVDVLAEAVRAGGHAVGFAFDGDGDRVLAVDGDGAVVDGDELLALAALHLHAKGRLAGGGIVVTVMTQLRLPRGDGGGRHRGRQHLGRRPLRARRAARARLDAGRRAVRPHHRHGLLALGRRNRLGAARARGAGRPRPSRARRDREAPAAARQRPRARPRRARRPRPRCTRRWPARRLRSRAAGACSCGPAAPSRWSA